jgi:DNA-binding GntR family transcriptional regulator
VHEGQHHPVREAVSQLLSEGLLEAMPNRWRRVPILTCERATDLMDVARIAGEVEGSVEAGQRRAAS